MADAKQKDAPRGAPEANGYLDDPAVKKAQAAVTEAEKKLRSVPAPNKKVHDEKVQEIKDKIEACDTRLAAIKTAIDDKKSKSQVVRGEGDSMRSKLAEMVAARRAKQAERKALLDSLDNSGDIDEKKRAQNEKLGKTLKYKTEEEIDDAIEKLEYEVATTSLTLQEEKKILLEIQTLRSSKNSVREYRAVNDSIKERRESRKQIRDEVYTKAKAINEEVTKMMEEENKIRKFLDEVNKKRDNVGGDIPKLMDERKELRTKRDALWDELKALRDDFRKNNDTYYKYQKELKAAKNQRYAAEKQARQAQYDAERAERALEEAKVHPFQDELDTCDRVTAYLKRFVPKKEGEEDKSKKSGGPAAPVHEFKSKEGAFLVRKKDLDEPEYFSGVNKKKGKGKKAPKEESGKGAGITHSLDAFADFDKIKLRAPINVAEVPKALEDIVAIRAKFDEDGKKKQVENIAKLEKQKAAADAAVVKAAEERAAAASSSETASKDTDVASSSTAEKVAA